MFWFQSLFFWIPLFRVSRSIACFPGNLVSILVFLDTSVPVRPFPSRGSSLACFNPCFSGYLCSGVLKLTVSLAVLMFQSLFFWIPLFRLTALRATSRIKTCFNPCFSGYLCSGLRDHVPYIFALAVSILVFLDTSVPECIEKGAFPPTNVSILVFLDTSVPDDCTRDGWIHIRVSILVFLDTSVPGRLRQYALST